MALPIATLLSVITNNQTLLKATALSNNIYRTGNEFSPLPPSPRNFSQMNIDNYIASLEYDPHQLLIFEGEPLKVLKKEGTLDEDRFIVVSRDTHSLSNGKSDIGVVYGMMSRVYPGSLLLANGHLIDNNPDILVVGRKPLKFTINLPGMADDGTFEIVPTYANYQSALNKVKRHWFKEYSKDYDIMAAISSQHNLVHSRDQLRVQFGSDIKNVEDSMGIDFEAIANKTKTTVIYQFKQIFYSVSVQPTASASELFSDDVTAQKLYDSNANSLNPPLLVDNVVYGRLIYLKLETSSTNASAHLILKHGKEESYHELEDLNLMVYVLGGGASNHIELIKVKHMDDVRRIITATSRFNQTNLGFPISYSAEFVKDHSRAFVTGVAEYVETTRTVYDSGTITLSHYGAFIAEFYMHWDELTYDSEGKEILTRKYWHKNLWDLTAGFSETHRLKGNVRNIAISAWECTGLAWEWWRQVINEEKVPLLRRREFSVGGTTLNPYVYIEPAISI